MTDDSGCTPAAGVSMAFPEVTAQLFAWREGFRSPEVLLTQHGDALRLPAGLVIGFEDRETAIRREAGRIGLHVSSCYLIGSCYNMSVRPARVQFVYSVELDRDGLGTWVPLMDLPGHVCLADLAVISDALTVLFGPASHFDRTYCGAADVPNCTGSHSERSHCARSHWVGRIRVQAARAPVSQFVR